MTDDEKTKAWRLYLNEEIDKVRQSFWKPENEKYAREVIKQNDWAKWNNIRNALKKIVRDVLWVHENCGWKCNVTDDGCGVDIRNKLKDVIA